jgi:D-alanyl-D-alanine dipeptidase
MYDYSSGELGEIWPRRRDESEGFGFAASVSVDDPATGRHCQADEQRIHPIVEPPPSELVDLEPRYLANPGAARKLLRPAYNAYVALKTAAEHDGIPPRLLTVVSGYRSVSQQRRLWEEALRKYGSPERARVWVAPPGGSAHNTGRAIDLWLGLKVTSTNVQPMRSTPAYRWLVCNARRFGFTPYAREPWHWEYTPPRRPVPRPQPPRPHPSPIRRRPADAMPLGQPPAPLPGFSASEERALRVTTTFEGGHPLNFSALAGDGDHQGISFGMLQWNFGQQTLQPMLRDFAAHFPQRFDAILGREAAALRDTLQRTHAEQMAFARQRMNVQNPRGADRPPVIGEPWQTHFLQLGREPGFQGIELRAARNLMCLAERDARRLGLTTERGLALVFDTVVQTGPAWLDARRHDHGERRRQLPARSTLIQQPRVRQEQQLGRPLTQRELITLIATVVIDATPAGSRNDVRRRRMAIVNGSGAAQAVGLGDQPWQAPPGACPPQTPPRRPATPPPPRRESAARPLADVHLGPTGAAVRGQERTH